ncbi:hypothetical protein CK203_080792 [Vitis vinifera]|uniref:Uncharacterized protein n=1 Tax=Vitis vinifera TaxID=29760 RepID=A0A438F8F9_VITVI|nr:hypothetical protein CK203_080792 [Vitis vinifera]
MDEGVANRDTPLVLDEVAVAIQPSQTTLIPNLHNEEHEPLGKLLPWRMPGASIPRFLPTMSPSFNCNNAGSKNNSEYRKRKRKDESKTGNPTALRKTTTLLKMILA